MIKARSIVLANLVLGENAFPELIQERCTPVKLADALAPILDESPARAKQLAALARIPDRLRLPHGHAERGRRRYRAATTPRTAAAGRDPVCCASNSRGIARQTLLACRCHRGAVPRSTARRRLTGACVPVQFAPGFALPKCMAQTDGWLPGQAPG